MFWLFAVWIGFVVVVSMIVSTVTGGNPLPGVWGHPSDEPRIPHQGGHRPAVAGRSP